MKKILLITAGLLTTVGSFAQSAVKKGLQLNFTREAATSTEAGKTTADGDTITIVNFPLIQILDSGALYFADNTPNDSGFAYGTNGYGDRAWAERFNFNGGGDSAVKVIGTFAMFGGVYTSLSTKFINFRVYDQSAPVQIDTTYSYSGFPGTILTSSQNFSIQDLGIGINNDPDSLKMFMFTTASANITDTFFLGYEITYAFPALLGDTIGLYTTRDGYRYSDYYFAQGGDTVINVQNAALYALPDLDWHDLAVDNFQQGLHLAIIPILLVDYTTGFKGITKNNLTFYGNYPNPAVNSTTIKYALDKDTDVTIQVMDMSGRVINTIKQTNLSKGEHTTELTTSNMAAGNYVYMIRTGNGEGMAAQFTVIK